MLDKKSIATIKKIIFMYLDSKKEKVFIFGTRATGEAGKFSDIDIGIESKRSISNGAKLQLEEGLENSDLPYNIDIVDFKTVSNDFRSLAMKKIIPL